MQQYEFDWQALTGSSKPTATEIAALPLSAQLLQEAAESRDRGHGRIISYSKKVFIPLTQLCRNVCHYCTFAGPPQPDQAAYMSPQAVLKVAEAGRALGCKEALFTLGDKPERRYNAAGRALAKLGYASTIDYLVAMAALVFEETGLLPHLNAGLAEADEMAAMRQVSASQGVMLESVAERLCAKGGPHYGSPDKRPDRRLANIEAAGRLAIPYTSGLLIGIGETRAERIEALFALQRLHQQYGHLQEIIIQNFRAKTGTKMALAAEPNLQELQWTLAVARLIFGPSMNIQAPPNLIDGALDSLLAAGLNDLGGISPLTPDFVNPERPWPHLHRLAEEITANDKILVERLTIYPHYAQRPEHWCAKKMASAVYRASDATGLARIDPWTPGSSLKPDMPLLSKPMAPPSNAVERIAGRAMQGDDLSEVEICRLFAARDGELRMLCDAADALRRQHNGATVTYVVTRNINYTNICTFGCRFCAFSKGRRNHHNADPAYDLSLEEIARRSREAWRRGASEVCMQGGIHPRYDGAHYLAICRAVKQAVPDLHIHAFSPLEIYHGAQQSDLSLHAYLSRLQRAGLGSLPGTAAEILVDAVRAELCPDKITTQQWCEVMAAAHDIGLKSTATIMFGHMEQPRHWAQHLLLIRNLQKRSGGFTEFVPLPFVPMQAPIYRRGQARKGPTFREAVLMHAVARLVLHPYITNIQTSWVKMGPAGVEACLNAGANDLGGTLMNESITRAAGAGFGEEMPPEDMEMLIEDIGRQPQQRTTLYRQVSAERRRRSFAAAPLAPLQQQRSGKWTEKQTALTL